MISNRLLVALIASVCFTACGREEADSQPTNAPVAEHNDTTTVAGAKIAELEPLAAAERAPKDSSADLTDIEQRVTGLLETLSNKQPSQLRRAARIELRSLGDAAIPALCQWLDTYEIDGELLDGNMQEAAAEALADIDSYAAAEALLVRVEKRPGPEDSQKLEWARKHCAWRIGFTTQDWTIPRLLVCLRVERNHEVLNWIANTLARFGNLSGLDTCLWLEENGIHVGVRREAGLRIQEMKKLFGVSFTSDLVRIWREGEVPEGMPEPKADPSANLQLEVWRRIRDLAEWQLRHVDEARMVLSSMRGWVAEPLALALEDESPYVRMHAAQVIERMGPRGRAAGPALLELLEREPSQAAQAAAALGAIEYDGATEALRKRLSPETDLELRVASVRALGKFGDAESIEQIRPLFAESEPIDLRAAAAETIVRTAPTLEVEAEFDFLLSQLTAPVVDPIGPEDALGEWILRRGREGNPAARNLWGEWRKLELLRPSPGEPEKEQLRLKQRQRLDAQVPAAGEGRVAGRRRTRKRAGRRPERSWISRAGARAGEGWA